MTAYVSSIPNGAEIDRRLEYVKYLEQFNSQPVGIKWDSSSSSPILKRIDINGNEITPSTTFFDSHKIWGGIRRCVRNRTTGAITYGSDNAGTGLTLDGTAGDVLVEIPTAKYKFSKVGDIYYFWLIPYTEEDTKYTIHPAALQRGGTVKNKIYVGAYEAYGYLDGSTFKLGSASGKQPVTGGVEYPDLPNNGRFTLDDAETYAKNIATGFGVCNPWTYAYLQLLFYIEYGSLDSQAKIGSGVVNLATGTGFAGKLTGADSIDSNIGTNGTGEGNGTNGQTPICWRGIENLWGNVWEFVAGLNMNLSDGGYKIIKRDGTGTPAGSLSDGSYETGSGTVPISEDGYITGLHADEMGAVAFLPSAVTGTSSTYLCDYFFHPQYNPSIVLSGGYWGLGLQAGISTRNAGTPPTHSGRNIGARIEYIPQ